MKKFIKPEIQVLEIRPEERIAACGDMEDYLISPGIDERYDPVINPNNGRQGPNDIQLGNGRCWTFVPAVPPVYGQQPIIATIS